MDSRLEDGAESGSVVRIGNKLEARTFKTFNATWTALLAADNRQGKMSREQTYKVISWIRAAVKYRAGQVAGIPFVIHSGDLEKPIYDSETGVPPRGMVWFGKLRHLKKLTEAAIAMEGYAPIRKILTAGNKVENLIWLSPTKTRAKVDPDTGVLEQYEHINPRGIWDPIPIEEMVFTSPLDVYDEVWQGTPDAVAANIHAEIFGNLNAFLSGHLGRGLLKAMLLMLPKGTRPEERSVLKDWVREMMSGARAKEKFAVMEAETVTPVEFGEGLTDLHNTAIEEEQRRAIAAAFGVPHSVVTSDASNFAVAKQDALQFMQLTGKPAAQVIEAEWNAQLFAPLGLHMEHKFGRVEQFQDQKLAQAEAVTLVYQGGVFRLNEARAIVEAEDLGPEGDRFIENPSVNVTVGKTLSYDAWREMDQWKAKIKAKGPGVEFYPRFLASDIVSVIKNRIEENEPIGAVFAPPWQ